MNQIASPNPGSPLLDHCPDGLPSTMYYDPAHHDREMRHIWARNWVYVGRANDLAPMTVRRISVAGENLILVKDSDDRISCFHNTCRHRGAELCAASETQLKAKLISCPYHRWSYDLAGNLIRAPFISTTEDFKKQDLGLFKVHVRLWNGFVFVCLADSPPDFDGMPDLGSHALDNWPMASLVTGHTFVKEMKCNWKIFWENYNECLHCPGIHPELSEFVPIYSRGYMADNEARDWTPETAPSPRLKQGVSSWSMNGQYCGPEFADLTEDERARGQTFVTLMPTMFVIAHADYVRAVSLRPLGPESTELRAEWLFPKATLEAPGFDLENVTRFSTRVMQQDGAACEMNQRGLKSAAFKQARLMPQEYALHDFHNWVLRQLAGGES